MQQSQTTVKSDAHSPLEEREHQVYDKIYRALFSINRPFRHISIVGTAEVHGETVFALKFSEGRNMEWLEKVFLARSIEEELTTALADLAH